MYRTFIGLAATMFGAASCSSPTSGSLAHNAAQLTPAEWRSSAHLDVVAFGALCDGVTADDAAFAFALDAANAVNGTLTIPAGRTCLLGQTFNLGYACPPGSRSPTDLTCSNPSPAEGVTIRGSGAGTRSSTIWLQPATAQTGDCTAMNDDGSSAPGNGGITLGPNVTRITFADVTLRAGDRLGSCLVNISHAGSTGDPTFETFHNVLFEGNNSTSNETRTDVFTANASWLTFDGCAFQGGSRNHFKDDYASGYLSNSTFERNTFWMGGSPAYAVIINAASGLRFVGNNFEVSPNALYIGSSFGGEISSNWFNLENVPESAGVLADIGCLGCTIESNWMLGGFDGLHVRGAGGVVSGGYFLGQAGTALVLADNSSDVTVQGVNFGGSSCKDTNGCATTTCTQTDIAVEGGNGHRIGSNRYDGTAGQSTRNSVRLAAGTTGELSLRSAEDATACKAIDGSNGGWIINRDGVLNHVDTESLVCSNLSLRSSAGNVASLDIARADTTIGGAVLELQNDSGMNNTLVLDDTVAGGAYGGIQMTKAGTTTVNIASGVLAGPTYFNAGDQVGIGTSAPRAKLHVAGGDVLVSSIGSGVILKSATGSTCWRLVVSDTGSLSTQPVSPCP
jgi:hypothetical protein